MLASKDERIEYLDSLRGLAALAVVAFHLVEGYGLPSEIRFLDHTPLQSLWDGKASVRLFFVLSGFVLALKYFRSPKGMAGFSYLGYATSRVFRIMPLFIVVLLLSVLARNYFFFHYPTIPAQTPWFADFWKSPVSVKSLLQESLLVIRIPFESSQRMIPQDWTLTEELKQSMLVPVLVFVALRSQFLLLVTMTLFTVWKPGHALLDFYLGVVVAQNLPYLKRKWQTMHLATKLGVLAVAVLLYSVCSYRIDDPALRRQLVGLGSVLIIIITAASVRVQNALNVPVLSFLGKISYGLYLTHFIFLLCLTPHCVYLLNQVSLVDGYSTRLVALLLMIASTILLSFALYQLIELPFIRWGKTTFTKIDELISYTKLILQKNALNLIEIGFAG